MLINSLITIKNYIKRTENAAVLLLLRLNTFNPLSDIIVDLEQVFSSLDEA